MASSWGASSGHRLALARARASPSSRLVPAAPRSKAARSRVPPPWRSLLQARSVSTMTTPMASALRPSGSTWSRTSSVALPTRPAPA
jgi:hypothetical protein